MALCKNAGKYRKLELEIESEIFYKRQSKKNRKNNNNILNDYTLDIYKLIDL